MSGSLTQFRNLFFQEAHLLPDFFRVCLEVRRANGGQTVAGKSIIVDIRKESRQLVKVSNGVRIVFVVVTLGATDGRPHPDRRDVAHPVRGVNGKVLLALNPTFMRSLQQTVVTRGHQLLIGWILEQVATQLFPGELIERKIPIERIDDVIAVRRRGVILVSMVSYSACKADQIQPVGGHSFAILGSVEKIVNPVVHHLVERSPVLYEGLHFFRTRRQTGQVEMKATNQGYSVGIRRRFQLLFLELGENEPVDPMVRPFLARSRDGVFHRGLVGPMFFILRPFENPLLDDFALLGFHYLVGFGRRHDFVSIRTRDAGPHLALFQTARNQGGITSEVTGRPLAGIETQIGFSLMSIRAMTKETIVREDRSDVGVEIHRRRQSKERKEAKDP